MYWPLFYILLITKYAAVENPAKRLQKCALRTFAKPDNIKFTALSTLFPTADVYSAFIAFPDMLC